MTAERWRVELVPMQGQRWHSPGAVRLRRAVKALARSYGLRVVVCKEVSLSKLDSEAEQGTTEELPGGGR